MIARKVVCDLPQVRFGHADPEDVPEVFWRVGKMDDWTCTSNRPCVLRGLRRGSRIDRRWKREHVFKEGGVLGEDAFEHPKLDVARDQDDISVFKPELFVPRNRIGTILSRDSICVCPLTFVGACGFGHWVIPQHLATAIYQFEYVQPTKVSTEGFRLAWVSKISKHVACVFEGWSYIEQS